MRSGGSPGKKKAQRQGAQAQGSHGIGLLVLHNKQTIPLAYQTMVDGAQRIPLAPESSMEDREFMEAAGA